tara:strand:+ start:585 stop:791 length:207 start_codon:yes stop_codon:yes gene_type:complete
MTIAELAKTLGSTTDTFFYADENMSHTWDGRGHEEVTDYEVWDNEVVGNCEDKRGDTYGFTFNIEGGE